MTTNNEEIFDHYEEILKFFQTLSRGDVFYFSSGLVSQRLDISIFMSIDYEASKRGNNVCVNEYYVNSDRYITYRYRQDYKKCYRMEEVIEDEQ